MNETAMLNRPIPQSLEIEAAALAVMLQFPNTIPEAMRKIDHGHFNSAAHRLVFQTICDLYDGGSKIDFHIVTMKLMDDQKLGEAGGAHLVTDLGTRTAVAAHLGDYLEELIEKEKHRRLIHLGDSIKRAGFGADDADESIGCFVSSLELMRGSGHFPPLSDATNFLNGDCPARPPELVSHVLHQGSKMIVGGTSKGRKTMSLIDLAVSIATGTDWWGFPTAKTPVCYLNFEIQDAFFWHRVNQVCQAKNVRLDPGMFLAWNLRGHADSMEKLRNELISGLRCRQFGLVVVDPIYKVLGGRDENKAGDVALILNELEKIAVQTQAAIAFGAHYSKGNQALKESIDRIGGSGVFARDPDSILTMTAHEEPDAFTVEATLRNFQPIKPFVVRFDWPLMKRDEALNPARLKQIGGRPRAATETQLLDLLEKPMRAGEWQRMADEELGISRRTFYEMLAELNGRVQKTAGFYERT
jgi:hypothetical protein